MSDEQAAKEKVTCVNCGHREVKYRCPSCLRRTCCLQCVKEHKKTFSCTGIRCKTAFVPKSEYNYSNMMNDYRFLEDTERVSYSVGSSEKQRPRRLNNQASKLIRKARQSGVVLRLMPVGMTKRMTNTSYYNNGNKCIMWKVKWLFPQADADYTNPRVSENTTVSDLLKTYIDPVKSDPIIRQRLKPYLQTPIDGLSVFFRLECQPANQARFCLLNPSHTLKECLSGKTIIEFPTFHVVLPSKAHLYKVQDVTSKLKAQKTKSDLSRKRKIEGSNKQAQAIGTGRTHVGLSEEILPCQNELQPEPISHMKVEQLNERMKTIQPEPVKTEHFSEESSMDVQLNSQNGQESKELVKSREQLNEPEVQTIV